MALYELSIKRRPLKVRDGGENNPGDEPWKLIAYHREYIQKRGWYDHHKEAMVFKPAILTNAASVVVMHNHPSGIAEPSDADRRTTRRLVEAGNLLRIPLLDHIIVGDPDAPGNGAGYFSFKEHGIV